MCIYKPIYGRKKHIARSWFIERSETAVSKSFWLPSYDLEMKARRIAKRVSLISVNLVCAVFFLYLLLLLPFPSLPYSFLSFSYHHVFFFSFLHLSTRLSVFFSIHVRIYKYLFVGPSTILINKLAINQKTKHNFKTNAESQGCNIQWKQINMDSLNFRAQRQSGCHKWIKFAYTDRISLLC